jgi:hypothetical protein
MQLMEDRRKALIPPELEDNPNVKMVLRSSRAIRFSNSSLAICSTSVKSSGAAWKADLEGRPENRSRG